MALHYAIALHRMMALHHAMYLHHAMSLHHVMALLHVMALHYAIALHHMMDLHHAMALHHGTIISFSFQGSFAYIFGGVNFENTSDMVLDAGKKTLKTDISPYVFRFNLEYNSEWEYIGKLQHEGDWITAILYN